MDLKERVKYILMNYPLARETNNYFMSVIWADDIKKGPVMPSSAFGLLQVLGIDALTSWDSATRIKRKIQEEHPELRGNSYLKRKNKAKKAAKDLDSTLF
jgi:hypothetical protein